MKLRVAEPDEYEAIGRLTSETYRDLLGTAAIGDYEEELHAVAERAADCVVLVAVGDHEELLGAVTYVPGPETSMSEFADADAAGIRMLVVRPASQGTGIGRALAEECIALARRDGRRRIVLHSTAPMVVARAMYQSMGFVPDADRDVVFTDPPYSVAEPLHLIGYVLTL